MTGSASAISTNTPPAQLPIRLTGVQFGASWRDSSLVVELGDALREAMPGCRVVGLVRFLDAHNSQPSNEQDGLLLRHIRSRTYRLCTKPLHADAAGSILTIDQPSHVSATDDFLQKIRQGHHGGPGRCQGSMTLDGFCYTRGVDVSIPADTIRWATRFGGGTLSIGLRKLASVVQEHVELGTVAQADLLALRPPRHELHPVRCKPYLDHLSVLRFRAFGVGNLSAGIHAAHLFLARLFTDHPELASTRRVRTDLISDQDGDHPFTHDADPYEGNPDDDHLSDPSF
jgi:hypothetical protein